MTWTSIATKFVLTVGASLAERLAAALSARIKQEPEAEANPVDIAIATKSAVSADREGKIASERGNTVRRCNHCGLRSEWLASDGLCLKCEYLRAPQKPRRLGDYGPGGE